MADGSELSLSPQMCPLPQKLPHLMLCYSLYLLCWIGPHPVTGQGRPGFLGFIWDNSGGLSQLRGSPWSICCNCSQFNFSLCAVLLLSRPCECHSHRDTAPKFLPFNSSLHREPKLVYRSVIYCFVNVRLSNLSLPLILLLHTHYNNISIYTIFIYIQKCVHGVKSLIVLQYLW